MTEVFGEFGLQKGDNENAEKNSQQARKTGKNQSEKDKSRPNNPCRI